MKKFSNKILVVVFLVLVALFVGSKVLLAPARESNLDADALAVDTASLASIIFYNHKDSGDVMLEKNNGSWTVSRNGKHFRARESTVSSFVSALAGLHPQRIASRKKEKWDDYQVGDTSAIKVSLQDQNGDDATTFFFGKETGGHTFVRTADGDEVFVVEGYLRQKADKGFNEWRDPALLRLNKDLITKITFEYPADSGFVVEKNPSWKIGGTKADSTAVENYLRQLRSKDHREYADTFTPGRNPDVTVTFTGDKEETVIKGWNTAFYEWVINSSHQPDVYFLDKTMALPGSLFIGKNKLVGK